MSGKFKNDVVILDSVDIGLAQILDHLNGDRVIEEYTTYVGSEHDVTLVLEYIKQRGFTYSGAYVTYQGLYVKLDIKEIKLSDDAVKPTESTEEGGESTDITYEEIIDISKRCKIEKTNELYEQVLENIIESANMGKCKVTHNIMWDAYHLADGVVTKLKEYGFTNARYTNALGDGFIIVEWELGE